MAPRRPVRPVQDRHLPVGDLARRLRDTASARCEKTKVDRAVLRRWPRAAPLHAISREKSPAPSRHPPASESRSDKAGADLVSVLRARELLSGGNVTRL